LLSLADRTRRIAKVGKKNEVLKLHLPFCDIFFGVIHNLKMPPAGRSAEWLVFIGILYLWVAIIKIF